MSFPWAEEYRPKHPFMRWLDDRLPLPRLVYGAVGGGYPVPRNLNYFWNFGVLAGVALTLQLIASTMPVMSWRVSATPASCWRCTSRRIPKPRSTRSSTSCAT